MALLETKDLGITFDGLVATQGSVAFEGKEITKLKAFQRAEAGIARTF